MERRLAKLQTIWPPAPCATCASRPGIVCVPDPDTAVPEYPEGRCPACGRLWHTVPILVGISDDDI
jgi:hypothetical protein